MVDMTKKPQWKAAGDFVMSEGNAIVAATSKSAEAIGVGNERGVIAVGRISDRVVLAGNPLEDIKIVWRTRLVMKGAELVEPSRDGARNAFWGGLLGYTS